MNIWCQKMPEDMKGAGNGETVKHRMKCSVEQQWLKQLLTMRCDTVALLMLLIKIAIDIAYIFGLRVNWSEQFSMDINLGRLLVSYTSCIFLILFLPRKHDISTFYLMVMLIIIIFPLSTIYSFMIPQIGFYLTVCLAFLILQIATNIVIFDLKIELKIPYISILLLSFCTATLIMLWFQLGPPTLQATDISKVYNLRASQELPKYLYYMVHFTTAAFIPFLVAASWVKKRYFQVCYCGVVMALIYLWTGMKDFIFMLPLIVAGIFVASRKNYQRDALIAILCITLVMTFLEATNQSKWSIILYWVFSLIYNRVIFLPSHLKFLYFDFFVLKGNHKIGLLGTLLAPVLTRLGYHDPYLGGYPKVIGEYYSIFDGSYANTGAFGGEMAHFGIAGIFIAGLCLFVFLQAIKVCEKRNGRKFTIGISIYLLYSFINAKALNILSFDSALIVVLFMLLFNVNDNKQRMITNKRKPEMLA